MTYTNRLIDPSTYSYGTITKVGKTSHRIIVGKFCSIADGVVGILTGHFTSRISTYPFQMLLNAPIPSNTKSYGDIVIGNDVWIGLHATIMGGVTIGDGGIVGAGAVVRTDVEPYTIYAGDPAKSKGTRFGGRDIEFLLQLKWWDWPIEKIVANAHILNSGDIGKLREV